MLRGLVILLAFLLFGVVAGHATPVWTDAAKAQALIEAISADGSEARQNMDDLARALALDTKALDEPSIEKPDFPATGTGLLVSRDLQLAMTQLAINIGTNNQIRVLRAQGEQNTALILQSGFSTLSELVAAAKAEGIAGLQQVNGAVRLTRPLVVWQGAGLRLEPGDILQLDAKSGAFLIGFGQIEMTGASVQATGFATADAAFRPFVLITGRGTIYAQDSRFSGLGMVGADPFTGLVLSARGLFPPDFPPVLINNRFEDLGGLALNGLKGGTVSGNLVLAARGAGISLGLSEQIAVTGNTVIGTKGGAGLKVAGGTDIRLTDNLVTGGKRNGISIGGNSKGVLIGGNMVLTNAETGIATQRATCVLVQGNSVARNGASGLRLNESGVSRVEGNALVLNTTAGLHVGAQAKGGRVEVADNLLAGNRVGLTGVAIGEVVLDKNNLASQMPRLFDGEFSQYLSAYLREVQQKSGKSYLISARDGRVEDAFLTACNKG